MRTLQVAARWCATALVGCLSLSACAPSTLTTGTPGIPVQASEVFPTEAPLTVTNAAPTAQDIRTEIDAYLTGLAETHAFSGAALVFQNGETLVRKGYGFSDRDQELPNTPDTVFRIGHLTIGFTAVAILQLQAAGKLNIEDPVCGYLTDCPESWQPLTIRHLLTNTSGLTDYSTALDFETSMNNPTTPLELVARIQEQALDSVPGESWVWSSSDYVILGAIIERAAGVPYATYIQDHILTPLKMTHTSFAQEPAHLAVGYVRSTRVVAPPYDVSVAYSAWGASSTVDDLLLWSQALDTEVLLPAGLIDEMFAARFSTGEPNWQYGYGWVVGEDFKQREAFQWAGTPGFAAALKHFLDADVTIVLLSNQGDVNAILPAAQIVTYLFGD